MQASASRGARLERSCHPPLQHGGEGKGQGGSSGSGGGAAVPLISGTDLCAPARVRTRTPLNPATQTAAHLGPAALSWMVLLQVPCSYGARAAVAGADEGVLGAVHMLRALAGQWRPALYFAPRHISTLLSLAKEQNKF